MKKNLIIYGIGRFAEYAEYVFQNDSQYSVAGRCMERSFLKNLKEKKINIFTFEDLENFFPPNDHLLFIAVGNNVIRQRIYFTAINKGYNCVSYISSKATVWDNLKIGDNCFIGEGSVIQPFTEIGNNSILFSTRIGHHCKIGNHTLLSATLLGGNVKVGDFSFLGLHSSIQENTNIGERNIIGMGTVISKDTYPNEIYSAQPSRKRNITFEDYYRAESKNNTKEN